VFGFWGMMVPRKETMRRTIKRYIPNRIELKNRRTASRESPFDFVEVGGVTQSLRLLAGAVDEALMISSLFFWVLVLFMATSRLGEFQS
jgi:hypothetical protein